MRRYSNTAVETTLAGDINAAATSITVAATTGFPAVDFVLALDADEATQELVLVTNVAGTTLTVTRGYDNTTAVSHSTGAVVRHSHAAIDFREAREHEAATAAHGATGAVVGTTNTQTLTNKTLTSPALNTPVVDGVGVSSEWASYTPTATGFDLGNAVVEGRYKKIGSTVHYALEVFFGSTSAFAGELVLNFPVAPKYEFTLSPVGTALLLDSSSGANRVALCTAVDSDIYVYTDDGAVAPTVPWTWANGDSIRISGTYEAA